jgi:hypothetical protein
MALNIILYLKNSSSYCIENLFKYETNIKSLEFQNSYSFNALTLVELDSKIDSWKLFLYWIRKTQLYFTLRLWIINGLVEIGMNCNQPKLFLNIKKSLVLSIVLKFFIMKVSLNYLWGNKVVEN